MSIWDHDPEWLEDRLAQAEQVGLAEVWEHVVDQTPGASRNVLLGIVGALVQYLDETDFVA